ncbi:MAG: hypothetical protein J7497_02320 [Chitinophagaceae bacterium]|nr:hypothetical protein [Chitinophagaceae bacterium]
MDRKTNRDEQGRDFPGYPHYPSDEDITNPANGNRKINADEELANSTRLSARTLNEEPNRENVSERDSEDDDIRIVPGTEADVTEEDLVILGDPDADQDMNDDELLRTSARVDDIEEEGDLDIPGSELDDQNEELGEEDEENNYYSLGGDNHESLEDDPAGGNQDQ